MPESKIMNDELAYLIESKCKQLLLTAGIVERFKAMDLYIWAINAHADRLILSIDNTNNPKADLEAVERLLDYVLKELSLPVQVEAITIKDHCCYGNCKGCLNGNPTEQAVWIGRTF